MISKRIQPSAWFQDRPTANLINVHSRGVETQGLDKFASKDHILSLGIRPEAGHSFIHLITTGAGEYYGANANADYFNKSAGEVIFPEPLGPKSMMLDGGLEKYHQTFMKYGGLYREHHNSKKGGISSGDIVAEYYNPDMHRGELVVKVANDVWADDLNKLASGDPITYSMGAGVKYDICSICGNKAPTRNHYCHHMKYQKMATLEDGNQVFVYNDAPHFHDISRVAVPADKIAYGLRKVASVMHTEIEEPHGMYLPLSMVAEIGMKKEAHRARLLSKLADMEKRVIVEGISPEESDVSEAFHDSELKTEDIKQLQGFPLEELLKSLNNEKIMLPPKSFVRIVIKRPEGDIPGLDGMPEALKDIFSQISESGDTEVLSDGTYEPGSCSCGSGVIQKVSGLAKDHSLVPEVLRRRIVLNTLKPIHKQARSVFPKRASDESKYLAKEYAKYQLSFLTSAGEQYSQLAVLQNNIL
jgi:hypothetical protein